LYEYLRLYLTNELLGEIAIVEIMHRNKSSNSTIIAEFEVLTAVVVKSTIFCDMRPCSPLSVNRLHGGVISQNILIFNTIITLKCLVI
jgi:hypothetical protein